MVHLWSSVAKTHWFQYSMTGLLPNTIHVSFFPTVAPCFKIVAINQDILLGIVLSVRHLHWTFSRVYISWKGHTQKTKDRCGTQDDCNQKSTHDYLYIFVPFEEKYEQRSLLHYHLFHSILMPTSVMGNHTKNNVK